METRHATITVWLSGGGRPVQIQDRHAGILLTHTKSFLSEMLEHDVMSLASNNAADCNET